MFFYPLAGMRGDEGEFVCTHDIEVGWHDIEVGRHDIRLQYQICKIWHCYSISKLKDTISLFDIVADAVISCSSSTITDSLRNPSRCSDFLFFLSYHPRERIENHSKNNRLYFQANMILIAVPFTAISVIPHISDTFHYRPCNKYKIEIRTYRNFKQEMEIFLTRIDKN